MKKIYILTAVLALLTLSLNAQDGKLKTATNMRLQTSSKTVKDPKAQQPPTMNELVRGIKGMSSVLGNDDHSGSYRAPLKINSNEYLVGPYTTNDFSTSGQGFPGVYGGNNQQAYIFTDLARADFADHNGEELVGFRLALAGNSSQTAVLYDFMAWPYDDEGYFNQTNRYTWSIPQVAGADPVIGDISIEANNGFVGFKSITVYSGNTVITQWVGTTNTTNVPSGWTFEGGSQFASNGDGSYFMTYGQSGGGLLTISSSLLAGYSSVRVVINAAIDEGSAGNSPAISVNGSSVSLTNENPTFNDFEWPITSSTPTYIELAGGQWHEFYFDEPITFNVADTDVGMYLGYRYWQWGSNATGEFQYPIAVNPNSTSHVNLSYMTKQDGTDYTYNDIPITFPSNYYTYTNIRSITVTSGNTTLLSYSYANNGGTLPAGLSFSGTLGLRYDYSGNNVCLYTSDGTGSLNISGDVLQGYSSVTITINMSTSTRNRTAGVNVNGTTRTTTSTTGQNQTWTVNGTLAPVYSSGWWNENFPGDLAVQLIFKSSTNPTIEISPATQTINDAAAGTLTVTGTDIEGNINVSAGNNDWYLNPTSLTSTGGDVSVTYTGTALSASTTVTASAANDNTVTASATVDYLADLYIVGNFGSGWDFNNGTQMTYANGTYTTTLTVNAGSYIVFARLLGNNNPWGTRDILGPISGGDWWMQGNSGSGNLDLNPTENDPIYFPEGGTYRITVNVDGTFTITKLNGEQTAPPVITSTSDGEYVTITATGNGTVTLNVPGYDPVSGEGSVSITIPRGYADNTINVSATAQESGKEESDPATAQINIPAGSGWTEMDGTYDRPTDLLSFQKDGEDIMMVDQFLASTLKNDHPDHYTYTLRQTVNGETQISTPVDIPVYKTSSTMQGLYTMEQIKSDKDMHLKANVLNTEMDYDVNPDHNVLYYSLYRGDLNETYPVIDVPHRISQLQKFEDNTSGTVQYYMFENHQTGIAPRYDHLGNEIAERLDTNWVEGQYQDQLPYVPVIWTFGLYSGREDGKNNSYGSDIKRETLGEVTAEAKIYYTTSPYGKFKDSNDVEYCIYYPEIKITGVCPVTMTAGDGDVYTYEPYMFRAWCTYDGARDFTSVDNALVDNGPKTTPFMLDSVIVADPSQNIVTIGRDWLPGDTYKLPWAFGVPVTEDPQNITFIVRFYYRQVVEEGGQQEGGSKFRLGNDAEEFFIAQGAPSSQSAVTAVNELFGGSEVVSVTYYNAQGMQSSKPFKGMNIVVTRYSNGSTSTMKVMK